MISQARDGEGNLKAFAFEIGQGAGPPPVVPRVDPTADSSASATARPPKAKAATPPSAATNVRTVLASLRARLRIVESEIRARKKLELERDQLQRLIRAAKTEQDNVRRLRAAG